jgi:endonuclease YncB( thermonuclease family)
LLVAAWWLDAAGVSPAPGQVERVIDGDTLQVVEAGGERVTLRLLAIDTPESGQEGGDRARDFVVERVCGSAVSWRSHGPDRYGRTVGSVEVGGEDLAVLLLREGLAWRLRRYLEGQPDAVREAYEAAWSEARAARRGLWAGDPQPPWEWRKLNRPAPGHAVRCADRR